MRGKGALKVPSISPDLAKRRASLGGATNAHGANSAAARAARAELETQVLVEHIRRLADSAPPSSPEQRERIISVLMTAPEASR